MILDKEKLPGLIKDIESLVKKNPTVTVRDIENGNNEFNRSVIMRLGESGYFVKDPYPPYRTWEEIPLSEFLKALQNKLQKK